MFLLVVVILWVLLSTVNIIRIIRQHRVSMGWFYLSILGPVGTLGLFIFKEKVPRKNLRVYMLYQKKLLKRSGLHDWDFMHKIMSEIESECLKNQEIMDLKIFVAYELERGRSHSTWFTMAMGVNIALIVFLYTPILTDTFGKEDSGSFSMSMFICSFTIILSMLSLLSSYLNQSKHKKLAIINEVLNKI